MGGPPQDPVSTDSNVGLNFSGLSALAGTSSGNISANLSGIIANIDTPRPTVPQDMNPDAPQDMTMDKPIVTNEQFVIALRDTFLILMDS